MSKTNITHKADKLLTYCERMAEEFQSRLSRIESFVKHNLSTGSANETILREFLSSHVAANFVVGQGFICDLLDTGNVSRQCDVLIYDQNHFPLVYSDGSIKIVLPRSVRMVIEVKTRFKKDDVHSAISNIESAKRLNKYITGVIFAFRSPSVNSVIKSIESFPVALDGEQIPTAILLLDKDIIIHRWSWQRTRELEVSPTENYNSLSIRKAKNKQKGLVMTFLLSLLFQSTEIALYESDIINMLFEMFEEHTIKTNHDVAIGNDFLTNTTNEFFEPLAR